MKIRVSNVNYYRCFTFQTHFECGLLKSLFLSGFRETSQIPENYVVTTYICNLL
jgi:hypothetical protein